MEEQSEINSLITELEHVVPHLLNPAKKLLTADDGSSSGETDLDTRAWRLAEALEALGRAESGLMDVVGKLKGMPRTFDDLDSSDVESLIINGWEYWKTINGAMEKIQYSLAVALIVNSRRTPDWDQGWADNFAPFQYEVADKLEETLDNGMKEINGKSIGSVQTPTQFMDLLPFVRFGLGKSTNELRQLLNLDDGHRTGHMGEYEMHNRVASIRRDLLEKRILDEAKGLGWRVERIERLVSYRFTREERKRVARSLDRSQGPRGLQWRPDVVLITDWGLPVSLELKYFGRPGRRSKKAMYADQVGQDQNDRPGYLTSLHDNAVDRIVKDCSDDSPAILVELSDHDPELSYWLVNPRPGEDEPKRCDSLYLAVEAWQASNPTG